jgi:hypothetical protein
MPSPRTALAAALASMLLFACASRAPHHGPVVAGQGGGPTAGPETGTADDATWMTLASHGARMRVPEGWHWTRKGDALVAEPADKKAALVFFGADSRADFDAKVRELGKGYEIEKVDYGKGRPVSLRGIDAVVYEDMVAVSRGTAADVLMMVGEAPNGKGVVVVFVMAWDATSAHDPLIIEAANSLRPI